MNLWRRVTRSLGARLLGVFLLLALAVTVIFLAGMQAALRGGWQDYLRPLVIHYTDTLVEKIGTPPDIAQAQVLTQRLPLRIRIDGPQVNWRSHPLDDDDEWWGDDRRRRFGERGRDDTWRPVRTLADGHRVSIGLADISQEQRPRIAGFVTLGLLLLLTGLAYGFLRRLLRPLDDIRTGAVRYGQGDFSRPIVQRRRDELGELAGQINTMAEQLHGMLDAKRQLLLAISHELRSPLTRARLNAELVEEGTARDALLQDLGEMRDLIVDLLESERLAAGHASLHTEPTDLNDLVHEVLATPDEGGPVRLALAALLPPQDLDRVRMRLLLRNLVDNARRHGGDAARAPEVHTWVDADGVHLSLRDHGPGVPDAQLARMGEAFHRGDSARQRSTGGVGLGLYLCRLIAQAHGGRLVFLHADPGLKVVLTLPLLAPAAGTA